MRSFAALRMTSRSHPEVCAHHGRSLVVRLEPLAQEPRQREEAVDGAGIVHVGRLDAGIDQPVGIGAAFAEGYFLTKELMDWFWQAYCPPGTNQSDLRLSPLLAADFKGLPPAFVLTAGYDPLRDEGRAYADRLIDAGIKTTYVNYPGTIHGFFSLTRFLGQGLKANDEAAAVLGAHFGT